MRLVRCLMTWRNAAVGDARTRGSTRLFHLVQHRVEAASALRGSLLRRELRLSGTLLVRLLDGHLLLTWTGDG